MKKRYMNSRPITVQEAERALYLDFEGPGPSSKDKNPLPLFAGVRCESKYTLAVLDKCLESLAQEREVGYETLDNFLSDLLARAREEDRRIVFWTSHEKNLFASRGYPPGDIGFDVKIPAKASELGCYFSSFRKAVAAFKNPKTSKTRKKSLRPKAFGLLTLIAAEIGYPRPGDYGAGLVGKWVRHILGQATRKDRYAVWTQGGKAAVTKLLKHNRHDCFATERVLIHLLETAGSPLNGKPTI